jgi:hypothetical protein
LAQVKLKFEQNRLQESMQFTVEQASQQIQQLKNQISLFLKVASFYKIDIPKEVSILQTDLELMLKQCTKKENRSGDFDNKI